MKLEEFDYNLPEELIAQVPIQKRDESRLMVVDREKRTIEDKVFKDLLGGGKENNKPIYYYKNIPEFDFEIKSHYDLAESLGLIDYEIGVNRHSEMNDGNK